MDLKNTSAVLLAQMIRNREVSVLDVTKEALNIIKEKEWKLVLQKRKQLS